MLFIYLASNSVRPFLFYYNYLKKGICYSKIFFLNSNYFFSIFIIFLWYIPLNMYISVCPYCQSVCPYFHLCNFHITKSRLFVADGVRRRTEKTLNGGHRRRNGGQRTRNDEGRRKKNAAKRQRQSGGGARTRPPRRRLGGKRNRRRNRVQRRTQHTTQVER